MDAAKRLLPPQTWMSCTLTATAACAVLLHPRPHGPIPAVVQCCDVALAARYAIQGGAVIRSSYKPLNLYVLSR